MEEEKYFHSECVCASTLSEEQISILTYSPQSYTINNNINTLAHAVNVLLVLTV